MAQFFPIVVEEESNGTFSAWVAGLPGVYAAADTAAAAKRGIRNALAAHLDALGTLGREPQLKADVTVLRRDVLPRAPTRCGSWASGRYSAAARAGRRPRPPRGTA